MILPTLLPIAILPGVLKHSYMHGKGFVNFYMQTLDVPYTGVRLWGETVRSRAVSRERDMNIYIYMGLSSSLAEDNHFCEPYQDLQTVPVMYRVTYCNRSTH